MSKLAASHKVVFQLVRDSMDTFESGNQYGINSVSVSIGDRVQANKGPEVIINQSTFDVTNLSSADYSVFEFNVNCYSKNYVLAAQLADVIYNNCPPNDQIYVAESVNWYIEPLDLFLEFSDRDDYQASVLIRLRDAGQ